MAIQQRTEHVWVARLTAGSTFREDLVTLLAELSRQGVAPDVVIDLEGVATITSADLTELLRIRRFLVDREARLRLTSPSGEVWGLILTTGLDKVFDFAVDVEAALAAWR